MINLAAIKHADQYGGLWAILPARLQLAIERVRRMDLGRHIAESQASAVDGFFAAPEPDVQIDGYGMALCRIAGELTKYPSSLSDTASMIEWRQVMRMVADDPNIKAAMLCFDSPGGTVAGTADLGMEIARAASRKPVMAYAEDLCASAAYWLAAQANAIFCNEGALVGSIGVYVTLLDFSAAFDAEGVKVNVVKAGEWKGLGVQGTEITPAQLADVQRIVDGTNSLFVAEVAKGRRISMQAAGELADGRVHLGEQACALGLCDGVLLFDDAMARLRAQIPGSNGDKAMMGGGKSLARWMNARRSAVPVRAALHEASHHSPDGAGAARNPPPPALPATPPAPTAQDFARVNKLRNRSEHPLALGEGDISLAMDLSMTPAQALDTRNRNTPATMAELVEVFSGQSDYLAGLLKQEGSAQRKALEGYAASGLSIVAALETAKKADIERNWLSSRRKLV